MGPLISAAQGAKVMERYIARGRAEGATLLTGGERTYPQGFGGFFVQPTVFADVTDGMSIARRKSSARRLRPSTSRTRTRWSRAPTPAPSASPPVSSPPTSPAATGSSPASSRHHLDNAYNVTPVEAPFGGVKATGLRPRERPRRARPLEPGEIRLPVRLGPVQAHF